MPSHQTQLLTEARRVTRLAHKAARLRRELKTTEAELRHAKKTFKALAAAVTRPEPDTRIEQQTPPLRVFGEGVK